jgi:hypothetical protein
MGWSGRASAPPSTNLARGTKDKEHPVSPSVGGAFSQNARASSFRSYGNSQLLTKMAAQLAV